jgi:hypothetical protein
MTEPAQVAKPLIRTFSALTFLAPQALNSIFFGFVKALINDLALAMEP